MTAPRNFSTRYHSFCVAVILAAMPASGQAQVLNPSGLSRPQEAAILSSPKPFLSEGVRFDNPSAGISLAGTFSKPKGKGPYPTVVLIAGSGPNNRDEEASGHKKFLVLADALNRAGIAVLRYDKRGVGQSTGEYSTARLSDFATDANAAVYYLRARKDVAQDRIGLIGDSEGGYIAPMLATEEPFRFMVLLSTAAIGGVDGNLLQKASMARAEGMSEPDIAVYDSIYRQVFAVVLSSSSPDDARSRLKSLSAPIVASGRFSQAQADAGIDALTTPYGFESLRYDPQPYLAKLNIPVLVINGALDTQAPPKENLRAMRELLKNNTDATILELPGLNHQLQVAATGAPSAYAEIPQTIDPTVLKIVAGWVIAHTRP